MVCICGLLYGRSVFKKVPFGYYYFNVALDIENVTATWLMDKCFIAGSRATEALNYSFPFPCFVTHYNCNNYLPMPLFHCCKN